MANAFTRQKAQSIPIPTPTQPPTPKKGEKKEKKSLWC